jgi:hypothetical protein
VGRKLVNSKLSRRAEKKRRLESQRIALQDEMDMAKARARRHVLARFDDTNHLEQTNGAEDDSIIGNDSDEEEAGCLYDGSLITGNITGSKHLYAVIRIG